MYSPDTIGLVSCSLAMVLSLPNGGTHLSNQDMLARLWKAHGLYDLVLREWSSLLSDTRTGRENLQKDLRCTKFRLS